MTNPVPKSSGGIPKWLIILVVILLIIFVGCCGGFVTCTYFANKAKNVALQSLQEGIDRAEKNATQTAMDHAAEDTFPGGGGGTGAGQAGDGSGPSSSGSRGSGIINMPGAKIPANFPSDVPIYKGMVPKVGMSDKTNDSGEAVFSSADSVDTVSAYYDKEMTANGWTSEKNINLNGGAMQSYSKAGHTVLITISPDGARSAVMIVYSKGN